MLSCGKTSVARNDFRDDATYPQKDRYRQFCGVYAASGHERRAARNGTTGHLAVVLGTIEAAALPIGLSKA